MSYIDINELKTHAYDEELQEIIRGDDTIATASIDIAVEFATSKLAKHYDTDMIFKQRGDNRSALLVKIIKDIAIWELIGLANPSIDYADKKFRYEQAVDWLNAVYKGMPANLPKKEELQDNDTSTGSSFSYHSNPKKTKHF